MGKSSRFKRAGREFEALVKRLEANEAPLGAIVKAPDMILDKVSKTLREVDASIRFQRSGGPMLVTIECRDRSRAADQAWIEQLVAKRNDIGADMTIGVSAKGFSKAARNKALYHGILLRETKSLSANEILDIGMELSHLSVTIKSIEFQFRDALEKGPLTICALDGTAFGDGKPILLDNRENRTLTLDDLLNQVIRINEVNWPTRDDNADDQKLLFDVAPGRYTARTQDGLLAVAATNLIFRGGISAMPLKLSQGLDYLSQPNDRISQFQNWTGKLHPINGNSIDIGVEFILKQPRQ